MVEHAFFSCENSNTKSRAHHCEEVNIFHLSVIFKSPGAFHSLQKSIQVKKGLNECYNKLLTIICDSYCLNNCSQ